MPADTTTPTVTAGSPPQADAQDPLPESNFLWRRVFAFALIGAVLFLLWLHITDVGTVAIRGSETAIKGLVKLALYELMLIALIATYYLLAPSAEQMTKMIQTARMLRDGVTLRSSSTASSADGTATTAVAAGKVADPAPIYPDAMPVDVPLPAEPEPALVLEPSTESPKVKRTAPETEIME